MESLNTWINATFGQYAVFVSGAVVVAVYLLKQKFGPKSAPVTPTPDPTPATISPRLDAVAPFINALLAALGIAPKGRPATVADVPHDFHLQLRNEVDKVNTLKAQASATGLKDLQAWDEPASSPAPLPK